MDPRDDQVTTLQKADVAGEIPPYPITLAEEAALGGWAKTDIPVGAPPRRQVVAGTRGAATARS